MARMRDLPPVLRSIGWWGLAKRVWQQIGEDGIFVWGSALAYSWLFAVFPFLIFLLSLVPHLPARFRDQATKTIIESVDRTLGPKVAPVLTQNIADVMNVPRKGPLLIGLAVTLFSASGGMAMTMQALDQCYDIKRGRPWYKARPVAAGLTIVVAALVLVVLILLPIGTLVERWLTSYKILPLGFELAFNLARYALAVLMMLTVLAVTYHFGPSIRQRFHLVSPGGVFSLVVWVLLDLFFRVYVDHFARYDQTYGAVGGVAILLLFFYISALVLLIGAEINSEVDFEILGVPQGSKDFIRRASVDADVEAVDDA